MLYKSNHDDHAMVPQVSPQEREGGGRSLGDKSYFVRAINYWPFFPWPSLYCRVQFYSAFLSKRSTTSTRVSVPSLVESCIEIKYGISWELYVVKTEANLKKTPKETQENSLSVLVLILMLTSSVLPTYRLHYRLCLFPYRLLSSLVFLNLS